MPAPARYDLLGPEPSRSGEWREGIERVWQAPRQEAAHDLLAPYLGAVAALNPDAKLRVYPGSPLIVHQPAAARRIASSPASLSRAPPPL